ncbi:MAG: hypothetical protein ACRDHW_05350 [Ktedonobacteraceae bacterium]
MINELQLGALPNLPQRTTIEEISAHIWHNYEVAALWLGGSLARGAGDLFSDVDFRIAVPTEQLAHWKTPRFEDIFRSAPVVGQGFMAFGDKAFLHHLLLANGEIFDFFVQSTSQELTPEPRLILACRDEQFAHRLTTEGQLKAQAPRDVQADEVQQLLVDFWINTHKHRKVLHRDLELLVTFGITIEKSLLLRLWYIDVCGKDWGDMQRQTIHSLTSIIRALQEAVGEQALAVTGAPMRNRQELYQSIERDREVVAQIGRHLAQTYGFTYPGELEAAVFQGWQDFLALS